MAGPGLELNTVLAQFKVFCGSRSEPPRRFRRLPRVGVLLESTCISNFKGISRVTGGSVAQSNCQNSLFSRYLRCLEYASSNQVVGSSNLSGRTNAFLHENRLPCQIAGRPNSNSRRTTSPVRQLGRLRPSWTLPRTAWRRSGAKRRTRAQPEQSVRAHFPHKKFSAPHHQPASVSP
jgi:hypothetical protein